jgi:hypothetical protein
VARFPFEPFLKERPVFNQLTATANKFPEPPLTHPGAPPDSECTKQRQMPGTPYKPYSEKPELPEPPYKPYTEKSETEPPYEPYKGI